MSGSFPNSWEPYGSSQQSQAIAWRRAATRPSHGPKPPYQPQHQTPHQPRWRSVPTANRSFTPSAPTPKTSSLPNNQLTQQNPINDKATQAFRQAEEENRTLARYESLGQDISSVREDVIKLGSKLDEVNGKNHTAVSSIREEMASLHGMLVSIRDLVQALSTQTHQDQLVNSIAHTISPLHEQIHKLGERFGQLRQNLGVVSKDNSQIISALNRHSAASAQQLEHLVSHQIMPWIDRRMQPLATGSLIDELRRELREFMWNPHVNRVRAISHAPQLPPYSTLVPPLQVTARPPPLPSHSLMQSPAPPHSTAHAAPPPPIAASQPLPVPPASSVHPSFMSRRQIRNTTNRRTLTQTAALNTAIAVGVAQYGTQNINVGMPRTPAGQKREPRGIAKKPTHSTHAAPPMYSVPTQIRLTPGSDEKKPRPRRHAVPGRQQAPPAPVNFPPHKVKSGSEDDVPISRLRGQADDVTPADMQMDLYGDLAVGQAFAPYSETVAEGVGPVVDLVSESEDMSTEVYDSDEWSPNMEKGKKKGKRGGTGRAHYATRSGRRKKL